jgi:hypothetical protein
MHADLSLSPLSADAFIGYRPNLVIWIDDGHVQHAELSTSACSTSEQKRKFFTCECSRRMKDLDL